MMFNDVVCEAPKAMEKKSINDIFNEMDYEEEKYEIQDTSDSPKTSERVSDNEMKILSDLLKVLEIKKKPKSFDNAVKAAVEAQNKWKNLSVLKRATSLHNIWKVLEVYSKKLSKFKNEALILLDYFDFYSDLSIQTGEYKSWTPQGVVLVVLSKYSPFLALGATVPAALGTGCSVIVLAPGKAQAISLFLEEIIAEAGLLEGLFNVVTDFDEDNIPVSSKINKVFFCGSYLSVQKFYAKNISKSFNFFCPNNTAALILESCDLNAAADKIVQATWGEDTLFAVSTIVVQESIHENFLKKLKFKIEQFIIENKNSSKFRDVITSEKISKVILQALNAGASVEGFIQENEWSPTVIVNYQNQDDEDVPVLKVLLCRTSKEGIALINNCRFSLGVSVWSEISSQALEISSMLVCPNIWINCHGVFQAREPLQLSAHSGDCVLGGSDGILEYISFTLEEPSKADGKVEDKEFNIDKFKVLQKAESAQKAFRSWQNQTRRMYLKIIADAMNDNDNKELSNFSEVVHTYAHLCKIFSLTESNPTEEFLVLKKKLPVGVILLICNTTYIDAAKLVSLITLPIVMGNAVIIILRNENSFVKSLVNHYNKFLPKNILNLIIGIKAGIYLASDPNIQSIWLYAETETSRDYLQTIRSHCLRSLKHIWVVPMNLSVSPHFFQKECLQNKVVWLTAVDQFP